jgi:protein TonB
MNRRILAFGAASMAFHLCILTWPREAPPLQAMAGRPLALTLRSVRRAEESQTVERDLTPSSLKTITAHATAAPAERVPPHDTKLSSFGGPHPRLRFDLPRPPETPTTPTEDTISERATSSPVSVTPGEAVQKIQSDFSARFTYPILARRRGWQGRARFGMQIESDGHLTRIRLLQGSGYGLLDQAALDTLQKVRLPAGGYLPRSDYDIDLVVEYRLTAGT